jgi:hypothetical protein
MKRQKFRSMATSGWNNYSASDMCKAVLEKEGGWTMFERLLEPGCTESPACQSGGEMLIATIETLPQGSDAAVRTYRCDECQREMRLTVWAAPPLQVNGHVFSEV